MLRVPLVLAAATGVATWSTCEFPEVKWLVADQGVGQSATQKVCGLGNYAYMAGYADGTTKLASTATTKTLERTDDDENDDMHLSMISSNGLGEPVKQWWFEGSIKGGKPSMSVMHGMADNTHLVLGFGMKGTMKLGAPKVSGGVAETITGLDDFNTGVVVKFAPEVDGGTIPWFKKFDSTAGSSISGVDGDADGNMYVAGRTCVPCVGDDCVDETDRMGRPTGNKQPTCSAFLTKLAAADGTEVWKIPLPKEITPYTIRVGKDAIFCWWNLKGKGMFGPPGQQLEIVSADDGKENSAIMLKISLDGDYIGHSLPGGTESISAGYVDLSKDSSTVVVAGSFSGTKTIGTKTMTAKFGPYTSYVASLKVSDGSVIWVEQIPMQRGVQVTSDNKHVAVFAQLTSTTDMIELEDAIGRKHTLRSRGSWDLIAMKLDATNGAGVWALDGGGNSMEYFHGFGMDASDNILISGYSRSSKFVFGDQKMDNVAADGKNKIYTVGIKTTTDLPECVTKCEDDVPTVKAGHCFIDQHCYANGGQSDYGVHGCYQCDAKKDQLEWAGPDVVSHCVIDGQCIAAGSPKMVAAGRGTAPSACEQCSPFVSTFGWAVKSGFVLDGDGKCAEGGGNGRTCQCPEKKRRKLTEAEVDEEVKARLLQDPQRLLAMMQTRSHAKELKSEL